MTQRPVPEIIDDFLSSGPYAVYGASRHRRKYGNKVFRSYLQAGRTVYPVHPSEPTIEGHPAFAKLSQVPQVPRGVSFITPPEVTEQGVLEAAAAGASFVWMQPGAESQLAIQRALDAGMEVIADGSCLLVVLGFRE